MNPPEQKLRDKLRRALDGADTLLAAHVLHDLTKSYFHTYAAEVASAQYKHGQSDAVAGAGQ